MYQLQTDDGAVWNPRSIAALDTLLEKVIRRGCGFVNVYALRRNIAYNLQHLEFLEALFREIALTSVLWKQNTKSFIVVGSAIIESLLTFLLIRADIYRTKGWELVRVMPGQQKKCEDTYERIDSHIYRRLSSPQREEMTFDAMIKKAEAKHVLGHNHTVYADLKRVRRLRNRVHLQVVDHPTDTDWNAFSFKDLCAMARTIHEVFTGPVFSPTNEQKEYFAYLTKYLAQQLEPLDEE